MHNYKIHLATTLFLSISATSAWAEASDKYDDLYNSCVTKAGTMNNSVVHACSQSVSDAVKKDMNRLYASIYKTIKENSVEDAKKFEVSQQNWLKYRNSHCELMGSYVGSPMYSFCPMNLNKSRVAELEVLNGD